jgi:tetratricopeptide (TPR) repeat protein
LNAAIQTDDRMQLEFSAPAAMFGMAASDNAAILRQLRDRGPLPAAAVRAMESASALQWRNRGKMMMAAGAYREAYADFARAIAIDPADGPSLTGLVETSLAAQKDREAQAVLERAASTAARNPRPWIALSRLHAVAGRMDDALKAAVMAGRLSPEAPECLEQLASVYTDARDAEMLPIVAERLRGAFPDRPTGAYYAAAAEFMHDRLEPALSLVRDAIRLDGSYADAHNLQGAILARLGQAPAARKAFDAALRLNPRDGNAYRNFGLLELASGNKAAAAKLFAEALALDPASEVSRQGLEASRAY